MKKNTLTSRLALFSVLLVIAVVSVVALYARGSSGKSNQDFDGILEFWSTDPDLKVQNQAMIHAFEKKNGELTVNLTTYDSQDYWTKIRLAAQQRKLPDVFVMSSGFAEEWVENGLLYDVSKYISELSPDDYYLNFFDAAKKIANTEKDYLVPFAEVITLLYYNKDLFDAAGLAYPTDTWTWSDFLSAARALTTEDVWGYWFYGRYAHVDPWVLRNNGHLIDRKSYTYAPDQNAMEAINFLLDLVAKERVAPSKKVMGSFRQQDVFPQGKAAMWVDGSWNVANVRKITGDNFRWGIAPVPMGPKGSANIVNGWADLFVIGRDTAAPDEAWEFIKYAISEGAIESDALLAGKIPVYKPYAAKLKSSSQGQPKEFNKIFEIASGDIRSTFTKGWSEWRGYGPAESMGFNGAVDGIIDGEFQRDKAFAEVSENAKSVLARYYK